MSSSNIRKQKSKTVTLVAKVSDSAKPVKSNQKKENRKKRRSDLKKKKSMEKTNERQPHHTLSSEAKVVNSVPVPVMTKKPRSNIPIDLVAFQNFIRRLIKYYQKRTDMATKGHTIYYAYYFWYLLIMHIKRVGRAGGSLPSALPDQVTGSSYAVPYPLAAWFHQLSPFFGGGQIGPSLNLATNFFGTPDVHQVGISNDDGVFPYFVPGSDPQVDLPNIVLCDRATNQEVTVGSTETTTWGDVFVYKSTATLVPATETILPFTSFVTDEQNLETYSNFIKDLCSTIPLGDVPAWSPDTSAHVRCGVIPLSNPTSFDSGIYGPNLKFDPEIAPIFSIASQNNGQFNNLSVKSMVPPKQKGAFGSTNYWDQLIDVYIYGYDNMKTFTAGAAKRVITFGGNKLRSFFPQFHWIDGSIMSQTVFSTYKQLLANKGVTDDIDPNLYNFTNLMAVGYFALQRRFNMRSPVDLSVPLSTFVPDSPDGFENVPQFVFADPIWSSLRLPAAMAKVIESLGPVVNKGVLRVPAVNYNGKETSIHIGNSVLGPFNWSVYGYTGSEDDYFAVPNLYTTNIKNTVETPDPPTNWVFPNIAVFGNSEVADTASTWSQATLGAYYGGVLLSADSSTGLSPMVANGSAANTIVTNYKNFVGYNNTTNVVPLVTPYDHPLGSFYPMTSIVQISPKGGTVERVHQTGFDATADTSTPVLDGSPVAIGISYSALTSSLPGAPHDILNSITTVPQQQQADPNVTATADVKQVYTNFKRRLAGFANTGSTVTTALTTMIAPHSMDPPDSTGNSNMFDSIAQATLTPNSQVAQTLAQHAVRSNIPFNQSHIPIAHVIKPYLADIANQLISGMNPINDPEGYYTPRASVTGNDIPKTNKSKHHPALKAMGDAIGFAKDGIDKAKGYEKSINKALGKKPPVTAEAAML